MATPAPTRAPLARTRLARGMEARRVAGMAAVEPVAATAAEVSVSEPPVMAAVIPAGRKRGCAEAVTRQTARVQAIKPWTSVCLENIKLFWKTQICLRKRKDEYL